MCEADSSLRQALHETITGEEFLWNFSVRMRNKIIYIVERCLFMLSSLAGKEKGGQ